MVGVIGQMTYVESTGDRSSLYYNYDTLDIINNFNNTINIGKIDLLQSGGSIDKIFNYKNIFTIVILCGIIFALNKIKKSKKYYE